MGGSNEQVVEGNAAPVMRGEDMASFSSSMGESPSVAGDGSVECNTMAHANNDKATSSQHSSTNMS